MLQNPTDVGKALGLQRSETDARGFADFAGGMGAQTVFQGWSGTIPTNNTGATGLQKLKHIVAIAKEEQCWERAAPVRHIEMVPGPALLARGRPFILLLNYNGDVNILLTLLNITIPLLQISQYLLNLLYLFKHQNTGICP